MSLTFFEFPEDYVQRGVRKHVEASIVVKLSQRFQRDLIIGIDENQILGKQNGDNVFLVATIINRYSRITWSREQTKYI